MSVVPEGDTVWRTATRLNQALAGKPIVESDMRWPEISTVDLRGRATLEVVSRGKHILHRVEGGLTVHSHLRMEGQWRIEATASLAPRWRHNPQLRALVSAHDWTALGLRLGMLDLVSTSREDEVVGHLGPDLLGLDWDAAVAVDNLLADPGTIGAALLDQRNLAGIGTLWCAETLFAERVSPWTPVAELDREAVERIVDRVHRFLVRAKDSAVQSTTGSTRSGETTYVHGRSGRPCRRCGTTVRSGPVGVPPRDRILGYCPACQPGIQLPL